VRGPRTFGPIDLDAHEFYKPMVLILDCTLMVKVAVLKGICPKGMANYIMRTKPIATSARGAAYPAPQTIHSPMLTISRVCALLLTLRQSWVTLGAIAGGI
jgi:hypothetical protein